jgi:tetratricopeptide (TPR) repeat protein
VPLFEETLKLRRSKLGPDHPDTLHSAFVLAGAYREARKYDRALPLLEEIVKRRKKTFGPTDDEAIRYMIDLVQAYDADGKYDQALPFWRELAGIWKRRFGADSTQYATALTAIGRDLLRQEKWTEAETVLGEALTIHEPKAPDAWGTYYWKSLLGEALLGQKKYAAAEPLLRAGYEGMKLRAEKIPPRNMYRLAEALDRLIKLAEATNKPDDAKRWKDERAKLPAASAPKPEVENP